MHYALHATLTAESMIRTPWLCVRRDGTSATDMFYGAADGQDGSVVIAGATEGSWQGAHTGGTNDFAAVKLDVDGGEIWRWQVK